MKNHDEYNDALTIGETLLYMCEISLWLYESIGKGLAVTKRKKKVQIKGSIG